MGRAVLCVASVLMCAAAPPASLTPEQQALLRQRAAHWKQAQAARKAGNKAESVAAMEKALSLAEAVFGRTARLAGLSHSRLADWKGDQDDWPAAARHWRSMVVIQEALWGERHWQAVDARLAWMHALAQAERTTAQRGALRRAEALNRQAMLLAQEGKPARALPLAKQAAAIRKEVLGERHPYCADSLAGVAWLHDATGDHKSSLAYYQQALALAEEGLGKRHPVCASLLNSLASLHETRGDHKLSLAHFKQALALTRQTQGEWHPDYAACLNNLACLCASMGDYKTAAPLHTQVLAIMKETQGGRHAGYATALDNLASLHMAMGDRKAALPLFREALAIRKDVLGTRHPDYAASLNNLAVLHKREGDRKTALRLYEEATALIRESRGEKHPDYVTALNNLAALHSATGEQKEAVRLYERALSLHKEILGEKHPRYADSLHGLALLHESMGDRKAALLLCEKAMAIRKEALGEKHPAYADSLNYSAVLHDAMGNRKAALPRAEAAMEITRACLRDHASVQSDRQQFAAAAAVRHRLDARLSIPDGPGHPPAHSHVLAWKGAILLRQQQRRLFLRLDNDETTKAAAAALQSATRRLASLRLSRSVSRESLHALVEEQDEAQATLSRLSEPFRVLQEEGRRSPKPVAESLPDGAILVDYLFFRPPGLKQADGKPRLQEQLTAFVARKGAPVARVDLGPAGDILSAARRWRGALMRSQAGHASGEQLKRLIWTPLEKHLEGAKVVLISPDGNLGTLPFAALPGKKEGTYLIEDHAIAVVPVPSALPEMMKPAFKAVRLAPSLLVVGHLRYDPEKDEAPLVGAGDRSVPRSGRERFDRLPATKAEMLAVEGAFRKLFKGTATALSEGEATKSAVRKALASSRYAHLATHGYFAPESVKSLHSDEGRERPATTEDVVGWHPLLLSGLALSDANREPEPGEEDGILTALEVSEMDLAKLELAVLSACETGLGAVAGGEGVLGMQRAFQVAGARSVVASLWKVDDRATQRLMAEFYAAAWDSRKIVSRAEALRQAQLSMLREGKRRGVGKSAERLPEGERLPPYYWAAFVLSGDWR